MSKSRSHPHDRQSADDTPSGVIRIVDDEGTQWTYSSIHDVPAEHRTKVAESIVESDMFETPPCRASTQETADTIPAVEIPDRSERSPLVWIVTGSVVAAACIFAAAIIVLSSSHP